ncbi:acyltransferase family protein [Nocardioides jishulii]|nr:acyltransferase [Nocardioides jishulii]
MTTRTRWERAHESYRSRKHFASLDGLRGISIIAVVWHHSAATSDGVLSLGYRGVDLFFAISGFLITTLLLREHEARGRIDFRAFFVRRALRIFPLYYAVLAFYLVLCWGPLRGTRVSENFFTNLPAFATYTTNWFVELTPGEPTVFYHAWSLATEEQFYLLWPPLLMLLLPRRFGLTAAGIIIGALAIADVAIASTTSADSFALTVFTSLATAICAGALMAIALHSRAVFVRIAPLLCNPVAPLCAALAVAALLFVKPDPTLLAVSMATLVATTCMRDDHLLRPLLTWKPLAYLGLVSYGMYLLHPLALRPMVALVSPTYWFPMTMAVTLVMAWASYRYLESPLLRAKGRFSPGRFQNPPSPRTTTAARGEEPSRHALAVKSPS